MLSKRKNNRTVPEIMPIFLHSFLYSRKDPLHGLFNCLYKTQEGHRKSPHKSMNFTIMSVHGALVFAQKQTHKLQNDPERQPEPLNAAAISLLNLATGAMSASLFTVPRVNGDLWHLDGLITIISG